MKLVEITAYLEALVPLSWQESYDNCGLLVGDKNTEVSAALICLDCTEVIVDEAIAKGCNLIIAHHPIIFSGLKKITGADYVQRTIIKAIQHSIAIYAIHTNLDHYQKGVNFEIGNRLGLNNLKILAPKKEQLFKLVTFVPKENYSHLNKALFDAGAGELGNYSACHFRSEGIGSFEPNAAAQPVIGTSGVYEEVEEMRVEYLVQSHRVGNVIQTLLATHPYEEVAYDLIPIANTDPTIGAGMIGELTQPMEEKDFLNFVKNTFQTGCIRHTDFLNKPIKRVAFCGGAGGFLLNEAKKQQADIFITADYKYHEFFDAENQIVIADIGHFESEQFTTNLIADILKKKFTTFAVHLTGINTNPINYF